MIKHLQIKKLTVYLGSSFLILVTNVALACTGSDISFKSLTVTQISSSNYQYAYIIKNEGTVAIPVNKLIIQNYVNTTATNSGGGAAGGSFINTNSAVLLQPGEEYSGVYEAYPLQNHNIKTYYYLTPQVYIEGVTECDDNNNWIYVSLLPDASIEEFKVTSVTGGITVGYSITIKNVGIDTLFFDKLQVRSYVSTDNQFDQNDPFTGMMNVAASGYLLSGQSESFNFGNSSSSSQTVSTHPYLITQLYYVNTELVTSNNLNVSLREATVTAVSDDQLNSSLNLYWDRDQKYFYVNDRKGDELVYTVYSIGGTVVQTGTINSSHNLLLPEGIYILSVSDGSRSDRLKIVY